MRISGITIPEEKRLEVGLTTVFGVGRTTAKRVLESLKIDWGAKPADLSKDQENALRQAIEEMQIEGDLKREVSGNIKRLKDIQSYRGTRHTRHMPARGQRTKSNSRTNRGNVRKTMASGKTKVDKK